LPCLASEERMTTIAELRLVDLAASEPLFKDVERSVLATMSRVATTAPSAQEVHHRPDQRRPERQHHQAHHEPRAPATRPVHRHLPHLLSSLLWAWSPRWTKRGRGRMPFRPP